MDHNLPLPKSVAYSDFWQTVNVALYNCYMYNNIPLTSMVFIDLVIHFQYERSACLLSYEIK